MLYQSSHMASSETPGHTDDHPPLPPSPAIPPGPGFPPLEQPKDPASRIFRSPFNNSELVIPPASAPLADEEDEAVKRSSKKKSTKGVSTRSEGRGVHTIEEEDPSTFTRMTGRQRKRSGRKELRDLKAENARGRLAAAARPPAHQLSSEEEL